MDPLTWALYRLFDRITRPLATVLMLLGVCGAVASAVGWIAPVWLVGVVGFILVGKEGANDLRADVTNEVEDADTAD